MKNRKWKLDMGTQSPEKKGRGFHRGGWLGKQRFGPALLLVLGLILGSTVTVQDVARQSKAGIFADGL